MKKIALLAAGFAIASTPAFAAPGDTDTATGSATAEVVAPISVTHDTGAVLDFGTFTPGTAAGTVVITQAGVSSVTGDVVMMSGSTESADAFTVTGGANRAFSITATNGSVTSGANSMAFVTDVAASGLLDGTGTDNFAVGGTLSVAANQAAGSYTGSYTVEVTYN